MNHTTKRSLRLSSMLLVGTALYLGACGPENLDDPSYIAQLSEDGMIDSATKDDAQMPAAPADEDAQKEAPQGMQQGMPQGSPQGMPQGMEGQPMMAGAPAPVAVVPVPVVQLPDTFVQLPPEVVAEPPSVFNTAEDVNFQRRVLHEKDIHVIKPVVEQHLIKNNLLIEDKFHTTVINHPTFRRDIAVASDVAEVAEVLPTTEVTAPVAVEPGLFLGGIGGFGGGFGGPIGCRPWLSGGFWRNCGAGPYGGSIPPYVVGPYFR